MISSQIQTKLYAAFSALIMTTFCCCNNGATTKPDGANLSKEVTPTENADKPCAPDSKLSEGAALLFGCIETSISIEERNQIFAISGLKVTADKKHLTEEDERDKFPSEQSTHVFDFNKDGIEEVVIIHGHHSLWNGTAGRMLEMYIKQKDGKYKQALSTMGIDLTLLDSNHNGFPDIVPGAGGMEFGLYHYDGKNYKQKGSVKDGAFDGIRMSEVSKAHSGPWVDVEF